MIVGETVEVTHADGEIETVENVLIDPQEQVDIATSTNAEEKVAYIFHFPIDYTKNLVKARITARGERFRVLGCPKSYTAENNLTEWNTPCKVARLGYTHTLEIQTANATQNEKGDSVTEWQTLLTTTCRVQDVEQSEEQKAGQTLGSKPVQITLDWEAALKGLFNTTARAIVDGITFDITSIENVNWEDDICKIEAVHGGE
jgi:head-tail adaptor